MPRLLPGIKFVNLQSSTCAADIEDWPGPGICDIPHQQHYQQLSTRLLLLSCTPEHTLGAGLNKFSWTRPQQDFSEGLCALLLHQPCLENE